MRSFVTVLGVAACSVANCQHWSDAGIVIDHVGEITRFHVDTVHSRLYSTGAYIEDYGQLSQSFRYVVRDEAGWSLSVPISNVPYSVVTFHDTVFLGGDFTHVDGMYMPHAACLVNGVWQSCGSFNWPVRKFKVIEDTLYALGPFSMINGSPCQSVAKRVGNGWECIGDLNCTGCYPIDIVRYQGRLVVSGTIAFEGNPYRHVMQLVDGAWEPVGPEGIYGGLSGGGPLAVYQDELYVGGLIPLNAGNAGYALQKWNGSAWSQVGEGLQDETGGTSQNIKVKDLMVHDGKLFVCGGFTYAGHEYAPRIATWDGVQWCSVGGDFGDSEVTGMAIYNDTLYIACGLDAVVDGQPIVGVAKFVAPAFENNCSGDTGIPAPSGPPPLRLVRQGSGYRLLGHDGRAAFAVRNVLGQELQRVPVDGSGYFELPPSVTGAIVICLADGRCIRSVR
ncbi:MAG TPA: hypothetical protein PKJ19_11000 [Flavobacteriales bacterium]|nr:hypothetical protein [Flavobacteriales bacterium]HNU57962.1 hypothetical protein [Flavobacteriales bacterium]